MEFGLIHSILQDLLLALMAVPRIHSESEQEAGKHLPL